LKISVLRTQLLRVYRFVSSQYENVNCAIPAFDRVRFVTRQPYQIGKHAPDRLGGALRLTAQHNEPVNVISKSYPESFGRFL
jgi:hypothetical protein